MSRTRATRARRPAPAPKPRSGAGRPVLVAALLAAGLAGWWLLAARREPSSSAPPAVRDPEAAIERGLALVKHGRFVESLPLLESVGRAYPLSPTGHHDYATALLNAVHQGRRHLGKQEFAVRSSVERVAMVRTALLELADAERGARDPRDRAWAIRTRAQALGAWGFPWEALVGYRQAEAADPTWTEMTLRAEKVLDEMEHPERLRKNSAAP